MADLITNNPNIIEQAGDFNLNKVNLISYRFDGEEGAPYEIDIKPITVNIQVVEDIHKACLMGNITVYDSQDVRTVLPITGLEKLELSFNTPGMPGVHAVRDEGFPFNVYKIEAVTVDKVNPRAQYYKIYFCSSEMYHNTINRVSRSYAGLIEYGVEDLLRSKLKSKKKLYYEPTRSNTKIVIPNLQPLEAIDMLSEKALSGAYKNGGYHFYETINGFYFRSIESMLAIGGAAARPSAYKFNYQITNTQGKVKDVANDMKSVIRYHFERPTNLLYNLNEGMFASKLITSDLYNKTITTTNYDYNDEFGNSFHTEHENGEKTPLKSLLPRAFFEDTGKYLSDMADSRLMHYSNTQEIHDDYKDIDAKDYVQNRHSQLLSMSNVNLNLVTYGNTLLHAGDIINFDLPLMRPVGDTIQETNPYWGGRYLILALKHNISVVDNRHEMNIKCMKDAVRNNYAIETNTNTINTQEYSQSVENIYSKDNDMLNLDLLEDI